VRDVLCYALGIFNLLLLVYVILSWVIAFVRPTPDWLYPVIRFTNRVVEPVLRPLRNLMPPLRVGAMAFDTSILLLFVLVYIMRLAVC
jgi:YggT family protein